MKKLKIFPVLFLLLGVFLVGCTNGKSPTLETVELPLLEKAESTGSSKAIVMSEFNLGKREYRAKSGAIMPYEIRGIIGVPEGDGPFPLVLITHGSHENEKENLRFDTGFDYLVQHLAEKGYIAISMDMSKPYIWKYGDNDDNEKSLPVANEHIEQLTAANAGKNPGYPMDLKGKIDLERIALAGHSRGGETAFEIAIDQLNKGVQVKAILAIAPTYLFDKEWPNVASAVLVPEYDGDVGSLDGYNTYRAQSEKGQGNHFVALLRRANHNYFNRNIERNDSWGSMVPDAEATQLTREEQEKFLMNFAADFFHSALLGDAEAFFTPMSQIPNKMYGFDVTAMSSLAKKKQLLAGNSGESIESEHVEVKPKIDSWFYKHDEVLLDTVTGGQDKLMTRKLLNIRWEEKGARISFKPPVSDFSDFQGLTLNGVLDSADELNPKEKSQRFTVELRDVKGNIARLILPAGLNALAYWPGEISFTDIVERKIYYWSRLTPPAGLNLPLRDFKGVDLKNIENVSLIFDQTDKGAIYLESAYLQ